MPIDKRVPAKSDAEVRTIAERTKAEFGVSRRWPVNILRCLESGSVLTLYGRKKLVFVVVDDSELEDADAKTEFSKGVVTITCRRSVRERAMMGVGRDRIHSPMSLLMPFCIIVFPYFGLSGPLVRPTLHKMARILPRNTRQKSLLQRS
jgi:hypothetical protein